MANMFLVRIKINGEWHDKVVWYREAAHKIIDGLKNIPEVEEGQMFECQQTYISYTRLSRRPYKPT